MKLVGILTIMLLIGCATKESTPSADDLKTQTTTTTTSTSENPALLPEPDTLSAIPPAPVPIKNPTGIYQFLLPFKTDVQIQHTVSFAGNNYELQEKYITGKRDSVVITMGTWSPSDGYIWLYKDQVVRGRYTWKGDTLRYFSPKNNRLYPMHKMPPALNNAVLARKASEGIIFYGVGNDPFWSVELDKEDSLIFSNPEFTQPIKVKLNGRKVSKDSTIYTGQADSLSLKVVVLPYFCSDGMSDFIYKNQIAIQYEGKWYSGCGIRYQ